MSDEDIVRDSRLHCQASHWRRHEDVIQQSLAALDVVDVILEDARVEVI
jgi:hypothetical protein